MLLNLLREKFEVGKSEASRLAKTIHTLLDRELGAIFKDVEDQLRKDLNNIPKGLTRGWLKLDHNNSGSYKISENENENTQVGGNRRLLQRGATKSNL